MTRTTCLVCNSEKLATIVDLGMHPFADTFLKEEDLPLHENVFPLVCDLCKDCGHVQLRFETNADDRYTNHEYSYTSANSAFSRNHWDEYAKEISKKLEVSSGLVVEAGSNDGYLTEQFQKLGFSGLGVDPSPVMAKVAEGRGVATKVALFSTEVAHEIKNEKGMATLVCANNVFNHSDNPLDFARAAAELLDENGTFVFEQPYWYSTIESGKFDQIYHEHVSYYTVKGVEELLKRAGLGIWDCEVVDYHGGSLRVYAKRKELCGPCMAADKMKEQEEELGLFSEEFYADFMKKLHQQRSEFLKKIYELRENGATIVAVGAAAKGNTLLNFYNLDAKTLSYVTDVSEFKQGKWTPYTRIPIVADDIFADIENPYALILSWNLPDKLKEILLGINKDITFITPWN